MGETKKIISENTVSEKLTPSSQKDLPVRPLMPRQIIFTGIGAGLLLAAAVTPFKLPFLPVWFLASLVIALSIGTMTKLQERKYEQYLKYIEQENRSLELLQTKAEADNARKTEFMADMSRKLRTPINLMIGLSRVSLRQDTKDAMAENLEQILSSGKDVLETVNDILDFTKIESGQMEFAEARYSLASLASDLKETIAAKPASFVLEVDDTIPNLLWGDEMRLRQILLNMSDSTLKHTKEGTLCQNIQWKKQKDMAILSIVFSIASRENQKEKPDQENPWTDLKFLNAKNLVEKMGGSVLYENSDDNRDSFTVTLPQKILQDTPTYGEARSRLRPVLKNPDKFAESFTFPGARVLVIDDSVTNLKLLKGLLAPYNMKAEYVLHVPECLERNWAKTYDLIFLDYFMPELNGGEILQYLQKNPSFQTPVVALTANAPDETREACLNWGFVDILAKPIQQEELERCLRQYLPAFLHTGQGAGPTGDGKIVFTLSPQTEKAKTTQAKRQKKLPTEKPNPLPAEKQETLSMDVDNEILDISLGIQNTAGEESFYIEILELYLSEAKEKKELLRSYLDVGDMKNYAVQVHALKSTMRSMGAMRAGELAFDLETHSKKGDLEYVREHHENAIKEAELAEVNMRRYLSLKGK
ncbi:MAG: response regulator [Roseburia sp.]|nr:response regulator [Roseburia sp.]